MNRAVAKLHRRRCALKNQNAGGYLVGSPILPDAPYVGAEYKAYEECGDFLRPGQIQGVANPEIAQTTGMVGGNCGCNGFPKRGGKRGGKKSRKSARKNTRKHRKTQRGGRFGVDVSQSVGGTGPVVAPFYTATACDLRAGSWNPNAVGGLLADTRASVGYSLTPNQGGQSGGGVSMSDYAITQAGGAYTLSPASLPVEQVPQQPAPAVDASCYKAPGSGLPVYPAESAGFRFEPSNGTGATLPAGVAAYNQVVPYAARMGGGYKKRKTARKSSRKSIRKQKKGTRKQT
jgi:hypothetical protein